MAGPLWAEPFRVALFHTELSRDGPGLLLRDILRGDEQVAAVHSVITHIDPDIIVLAGVDHDLRLAALTAFNKRLNKPFSHIFASPPNRGRWRNDDYDGDGRLGEPEDAEGYGAFLGADGAAILSRFPFRTEGVIDLTDRLWSDLPGTLHGDDIRDGQRLSTTVHWDVPVITPFGDLRLWVWHATPPVFDGPRDENGRRNRDEVQVWVDRLEVERPDPVVVIGVANLDPVDGDGRADALGALLTDERLQDPRPTSLGGLAAADPGHRGDPALDTANWPSPADGGPGNLRVDYILPDRRFSVLGSGVFWPAPGTAEDASFGQQVRTASRHRLVWVDLEFER